MTMRRILCVLACALLGQPAPAAAAQWEPISLGSGETRVVAVASDPETPSHLLAATEHALYASADGGASWSQRFRAPGQARVSRIALASGEPSTILAATDRGLYASFDGGARWSRVFRGSGAGEAACTHVAFHPAQRDTALLGTRGGLFRSLDGGRHWKEVSAPPAARDVIHFAFDPKQPDRLYLLATEGLFAGDLSAGTWQQTWNGVSAEETGVEEPTSLEATETDEENGSLHRLSAIAADPRHPETLYLAGSRGLAQSQDGGRAWRWLTRAGLGAGDVSRLLLRTHSPLIIFAATPQGVARYDPDPGRWTVLAQGMAALRVHDLAATPSHLWAATDLGLYRYQLEPALDVLGEGPPPSAQELLANFVHEPTMAEVREAAIRYAEVHPDKIRWWRRQAALQAFLPSVDLGFDYGRSRDISIDEGSFPNFQFIKSADKDDGLDVSVNWDLGELIWNQDQTSIDVRSKLMVQLRDDIVDEVTRTYFERRRLQVALLTEPVRDAQARLEQELRLQELTAMLDGLTGGYFSTQLKMDHN